MIIKLPAYRSPDYPLQPVNCRRENNYNLHNLWNVHACVLASPEMAVALDQIRGIIS